MRTLRQVNIKNRRNYFFNTMTNIENFDPRLLNIDQISFKSTDCVIYDISNISNIYDKYFKNLNSKNFLHLVFNKVDAYIEKNNKDKYLNFALAEKNKEALENYTELWDEIKDEIELINGNESIEYKKYFMKIRFEPDDDLPLGKMFNIPVCIIIVRFVFQESNNYYPKVFLHEFFYENEDEDEGDLYVIV